ncbi:MAG: DNA primase [Bacteroidetes bacterium SW_11_45_7]|nr:MAG: DNA primase [Bacteroidetes bacterium SW_11_45_7]
MIPQSIIDQILSTADIEEIVEEFVHLKKRGANLIGLCPFHDERTPSFSVSPSKGIYKCFGCGASGNPVNFIMEHEQLSYPEALRYLADKYNIEIPEEQETTEEQQAQDLRESLLIINQFAQRYFRDNLANSEEGKTVGQTYFQERGYSREIIDKFQLGYALSSWDAFTQTALENGYQLELLQKLGLTKDKDGKHYDFFRERVIFPIHNLAGKPIAFAGRTLKKDDKLPKYINSPESEVYHKSKVLYGAHLAKGEIRKQDECLLVEGYTDVISMHQNGIENVVASSGTSLTDEQVKLIKRFSSNITIVYDGDAAGQAAADRGINMILEKWMNVKLLVLPEGEDPDSFVKSQGGSKFREFCQNQATDFILYKTKKLLEQTKNDPTKRAKWIHDIVESIAIVPDQIQRELYVKECSELLAMDEQTLTTSVKKERRKNQNKQRNKKEVREEDAVTEQQQPQGRQEEEFGFEQDSTYQQEKEVISMLLEHGGKEYKEGLSVTGMIIHELGNFRIEHKPFEQIYKIIAGKYAEGEYPDQAFFLNHDDPNISQSAIDLLHSPYEISEYWEKWHDIPTTEPYYKYKQDALFAVERLKLKHLRQEIIANQQKIKQAEDEQDNHQVTSLLQYQQALLKEQKTVCNILGTVVPR